MECVPWLILSLEDSIFMLVLSTPRDFVVQLVSVGFDIFASTCGCCGKTSGSNGSECDEATFAARADPPSFIHRFNTIIKDSIKRRDPIQQSAVMRAANESDIQMDIAEAAICQIPACPQHPAVNQGNCAVSFHSRWCGTLAIPSSCRTRKLSRTKIPNLMGCECSETFCCAGFSAFGLCASLIKQVSKISWHEARLFASCGNRYELRVKMRLNPRQRSKMTETRLEIFNQHLMPFNLDLLRSIPTRTSRLTHFNLH